LTPPEIASLFSNYLQSITIQRGVIKPPDDMKSSGVFATSKGSIIAKDASKCVRPQPRNNSARVLNLVGNSTPRSVAHTRYDRLLNDTPKNAAAARLAKARREKAWT
jgi:hypothetical protein